MRSPSPAGTELRPAAALTPEEGTPVSGDRQSLPPAPTPQAGAGSLAAKPSPDVMRKPSEQPGTAGRGTGSGSAGLGSRLPKAR